MVKLSDDKKWYSVCLRLMGDSLAVDEITSKLDLVPSSTGKKGELHRVERYRSNIWVWNYPADSDVPFEEQISGLLGVIEPKKEILKEILSLPDVEGELFLGFGSFNGQGGAYFSPDILRRVADCGLSIDMDLYPGSDDDDEENE